MKAKCKICGNKAIGRMIVELGKPTIPYCEQHEEIIFEAHIAIVKGELDKALLLMNPNKIRIENYSNSDIKVIHTRGKK